MDLNAYIENTVVKMNIEDGEILDLRIMKNGDVIDATEIRRFPVSELEAVEKLERVGNPTYIPLGDHDVMLDKSLEDLMLVIEDESSDEVFENAEAEYVPAIKQLLEDERIASNESNEELTEIAPEVDSEFAKEFGDDDDLIELSTEDDTSEEATEEVAAQDVEEETPEAESEDNELVSFDFVSGKSDEESFSFGADDDEGELNQPW